MFNSPLLENNVSIQTRMYREPPGYYLYLPSPRIKQRAMLKIVKGFTSIKIAIAESKEPSAHSARVLLFICKYKIFV